MLEQFYDDIHIDGQKIVATLDDGKLQHYVVNSTEEIIPFLKKFPEYNTYHSVGSYQGLKAGKRFAISNDLHHKKGPKKGELIEAKIPDEAFIGAKSFGFDLDVGDDPAKYDSLEEAYADLARAIEEGHMPEPRWTMYSGGGLQFTLVLGGDANIDGLPEELWTARFQQLRSHISQHLKIDRTVGSHPYRLLRSPCTPNWKYEEPVDPVILNEEPGPFLTFEWMDTLEPAKPVPSQSKVAKADDVSLNCDQPVALKQVVKACAAMKHEYETKGETTSYPVWFAAGNITAHTFEFRKGFHHISKGHPDYDKEEVDDKFTDIVNRAASGPMGCEHFGDRDDPDSPCFGCWAGKAGFNNPISATRHLGKKPPPEPTSARLILDEIAEITDEELNDDNNYGVPDYHLPDGFWTDGEQIQNDDGFVCQHFWVRPMQYNQDRELGNILVSPDRVEWFAIAAKKLSMPAQLTAELMNQGIMVYQDQGAMMYVRHGSLLDTQTVESSKFGWDKDFASAYLPTGVVGDVPTEPSQDLLRLQKKWGSQKGTLEGWLKAVEMYSKPGQEPYLTALLASLSSPLLSYHNLEKGVIMSLTGPGGTGKTTGLRAASSVWGYPLATLSSMSSTFVATRIYLGLCGNLPMILDEVTQMQSEDLKQFALEISQGLGRERGTKDASLAHSETWQLNCLTTSNVSVHSKLAELVDVGSADMDRVIELPVVVSEHVSVQDGNELLEGIHENHGHIGPIFMEHILSKNITKERKVFGRMYKSLWDKDRLRGSDRFTAALIASCYWTHKRIKEVVPDFPGDPDVHFTWMRRQLKKNKSFIHDVLTVRIPEADDFILDFMSESLLLSEISGEKGYPTQGSSMKGYIYDREDWVIVTKPVLDSWCKRHQLKPVTVLQRWGQSGRLKNMGPEDGQYRWSGKLTDGLLIEGKKQYPTVTMIHKGKDYEAKQPSDRRTGKTKDGAISFEAHRERLRKGSSPK